MISRRRSSPQWGNYRELNLALKLVYLIVFGACAYSVSACLILINMAELLRLYKRLFFGFLFFPAFLSAQKFHFQNYNVQQGLIQSQVIAITQDHYDNLWFCTLGGISRFDGKVFTNYSETDGLLSNYANCIMADHDSNIWIGTSYGVSRFNGAGFKSIRLSANPAENVVRAIQAGCRSPDLGADGGKFIRSIRRINLYRPSYPDRTKW